MFKFNGSKVTFLFHKWRYVNLEFDQIHTIQWNFVEYCSCIFPGHFKRNIFAWKLTDQTVKSSWAHDIYPAEEFIMRSS